MIWFLFFKFDALIICLFWDFQYIHGLAAHGVHYIHRPGPTLQDTGYHFLPVGTTTSGLRFAL